MANDIEKFRDQFEKLEKKDLKDLGLSAVEKQFKHFEECYARCLKLEEELQRRSPVRGSAASTEPTSNPSRGIRSSRRNSRSTTPRSMTSTRPKNRPSSCPRNPVLRPRHWRISRSDREGIPQEQGHASPASAQADRQANRRGRKVERDLRRARQAQEDARVLLKVRQEGASHHRPRPAAEKPEEIELPKELDPKELDKAEKTASTMLGSIKNARKNVDAFNEAGEPIPPRSSGSARSSRCWPRSTSRSCASS